MIRGKCCLGEFLLADGKFVEGRADLEALFEIYSKDPPNVCEGPLDFALADRMCRDPPGGYEILDEEDPDEPFVNSG